MSGRGLPSHLSSIGFPVGTDEEAQALVGRVANDADELDTPDGCYLRYADASGAELWLHMDAEGVVVDMHPHYAGRAAMPVAVTRRVPRADGGPLGGAFHGWADPGADDPESGAYPFVFDAPEAALHAELELPCVTEVQLAAFAHELTVFGDADAYAEANEGRELPYAAESFIPSGLFVTGDEPEPAAEAFFTGTVLAARGRMNETTGDAFWWARVRTLGGEIEIVADPVLLTGPVTPGAVVQGSFWLSGRLPAE
jgi:hypothetical protein